jgi:hypothetical protein
MRQLDVSQQDVLDDDTSFFERSLQALLYFVFHLFTRTRVQSICGVPCRSITNHGPQGGFHDGGCILAANALENGGCMVGIEVVNKRGVDLQI